VEAEPSEAPGEAWPEPGGTMAAAAVHGVQVAASSKRAVAAKHQSPDARGCS
jgi:hypothetical protein